MIRLTVEIEKTQVNKQSTCPYCKNPHKKGIDTVRIEVHDGPAGTKFLCKKHAKKLAEKIMEIL